MELPLPRSIVAEDRVIWSMFFASIVSMDHHPGNDSPMALDVAAEVADRMLQLYMRRFPWPG